MEAVNKKENTYGKLVYLWLVLGAVALIVFDQLMKYAAVINLKDKPSCVLIDNVLELRYLENRGAAFSMLQDKQIIFSIITIIFVIVAVYVLVKVPKNKFYMPLVVTVLFLFSGAIGNFIDRLSNGYVVDFIYFSIIDFSIFNVADIYVSLSVIDLVILILFKYKDADLDFVKTSKKKDK